MQVDLSLVVAAGSFIGPVLAWLAGQAGEVAKQAGSGIVLGMAGNWVYQLAEFARTKGIAAFARQMAEGKLPANHDIARASRSALADALSWMAREMAQEPATHSRTSSVLAAIQRGKPREHRKWIAGLRALAHNDQKLLELDHRNLSGADVDRMLRSITDKQIGDELHTRVLAWLDKHLVGTAPEQLKDFLDQGWLLPDGKGRLTLYQAWCWYFRENIKRQPEVFNSFVSTALADLLGERAEPVNFAEVFSDHLKEPLDTLLEATAATLQLSKRIDETTQGTYDVARRTEVKLDAMCDTLGIGADVWADGQTFQSLLEQEVLEPAQQSLLTSISAPGGTLALESQTIQAAIDSPINGLRGYLLHRYARACRRQGIAAWLDSGEIQLDADFIDLQLLGDAPVARDPEQRFDSLSEMLAQPAPVDAWVLVGDAGGGKTTILRHHEMQNARGVLLSLSESGKGSNALVELCIWFRLATYRRERAGNNLHWPDCEQWLQAQWACHAATTSLPPLTLLRRYFRLRFFLDGINEIEPGIDPAIRQQAMLRFAEWLNTYKNAQQAPVFSVRRHDRGMALLDVDGLRVREVDLVRWNPERIEQFCHQGRSQYTALWNKLKADPSLLALCQVPFNLAAQCALHDQGYVADSRADLFLGLVWLSLRRALKKGDLSGPGLLSALDQNKISDRKHWKVRRRILPAEGTLLRGLEQQAWVMAHELEVAYATAARFSWPDFNRPAWFAAVQAIGVAEVRTDDTGDRFAFAHQLWQEFFTACGLVEHPAALAEMSAPKLEPKYEQLGPFSGQESLPKSDILNWEEAVKLAVQLALRPEEMVSRLAAVNLALTGRAAAECLSRIPTNVASSLRASLLERSRDKGVDLRLRIEAAEALGLMGDIIRYERCGGSGTASAPHLLPRGDLVRTGNQCLGWVRVPDGIYAIGSRKGQPGTDSDEWGPGGEPVSVHLKSFDIAFAPVTNCEFALFLQDGGYENERWWPGDLPGRWRRGELRDDGAREWQMRRHAALIEDFEDGMRRFFFSPTPANMEFAKSLSKMSREEAEAKFDSLYPFSGKPPIFMDVPTFNNPLQPVVGVSLFEAEAYCSWLSVQSGLRARLPTEAEWEAAARGPQLRTWPWGEQEPTLESLNADRLHLLRTSPVGVFPLGDTQEGMIDAAGNVWEWTTSEYTPAGLSPEHISTAAAPEALRTVRGGGHDFSPAHCRPGYRFKCHPLMRNNAVGFRIVCD